MTTADLNIDRIVREVVARLEDTLRGSSASSQAITSATAAPTASADELRLTNSVVSLAALEGQLGGVRRLVLAKRAVVTPAVHDLLREKDIALSFLDSKAVAERSNFGLAAVALSQQRPWMAIAERALGANATEFPCAESFVRATSEELRTCPFIVLTDQPELLACLANRSEHVRAISAHDEKQLDLALATLRPNLIAVRPHAAQTLEAILERLMAENDLCEEVS